MKELLRLFKKMMEKYPPDSMPGIDKAQAEQLKMMMENYDDMEILYAVMLTLLFLLILGLIVGGILLFQAKGDFYSALKGELMNSVFYSAGFLLVFSSILYTPFSYGISLK